MELRLTIKTNRPQAEIDTMLEGFQRTFADLRAEVRNSSSMPEPQIGISEADARRIASELRIAIEEVAPGSEVIIRNHDEGYGLQVLLPAEYTEATLRPIMEIAVNQGAPVSIRKLGGMRP